MPKKEIQGRCRLCNSDSRLVASHIIPNFHYGPLKRATGHFFVLSPDPSKKLLKKQRGITEYLLCAECDNVRLSQYENHLAKVLFGGHPLMGKIEGPLLMIEGYDYKKVKNGLLSILWRMSVSSDPIFSEVDLGPQHEERLRLALFNDTEIPEQEYAILLVAPLFDGKSLTDLILAPDCARVDGNRVYRCVISGLIFSFIVGSARLGEMEQKLILRSQSWPIGRARVEDIPFLHDACMKHGWANAKRAGK